MQYNTTLQPHFICNWVLGLSVWGHVHTTMLSYIT